jgi:aryl-alcohol dehydrogenase-like predicted oxidoreductase
VSAAEPADQRPLGGTPAGPDDDSSGGAEKYFTEQNYALIDLLEQLAAPRGASVAQLALAWLLQRPAITAPIVGANSVEQLDDILGALMVQLTAEEVAQIDAASD